MDWDKYISLINILNLKLADIRKVKHIIIDSSVVTIDEYIKDTYFTNIFYTNLIKVSHYIKDKFSDTGVSLEIQIDNNEVGFTYVLESIRLKKCLKLQKEYRDKQIFDMKTLIMFDNPLNKVCNLYIKVSYIDNLIKKD